jgi:hypothetical protein
MSDRRLKITFPANTPVSEIEEAVEVGFGGMGAAYRGPNRIVFLHNLEMPYELVTRQLAEWQQDGWIVSWEAA